MSDIKANDGNAVRREADTPAPQFGEPWTHEFDIRNMDDTSPALIRDCDGNLIFSRLLDGQFACSKAMAERICQCVSALAGIPDPQAFVREVRELLKDCAAFVRERDQTDHYRPDIRAQQLRNRIDDKLARLDAGRGK